MQNCYSKKKASDEEVYDQNGRLTTKHIQTLKFMQEVASENKLLKERVEELELQCSKCQRLHELAETAQERIKQIQSEYLAKADDINKMLTERHRAEMMKKVEEDIEREKLWTEEKHQMTMEVATLKRKVSELELQLASTKKHAGEKEILALKIESLHQEIDRLKEENEKQREINQVQQVEMQRLTYVEDQNKNLLSELRASEQKIQELKFKISRLEKDSAENGSKEQEDLLENIKHKMQKMINEQKAADEREKNHVAEIESLKSENEKLRRALKDSERMRAEMQSQLDLLLQELGLLKKQVNAQRDDQTFRDFVKLKREMGLVLQENQQLREKLKMKSNKAVVLPILKSPSEARLSAKKNDKKYSFS